MSQPNIDRFSGFSNLYDAYRPVPPRDIPEILCAYLSRDAETVVDLGCGTGLSTFIWSSFAQEVIGIEPNKDMRTTAEKKLSASPAENIRFARGFGNKTGLPAHSADIVTCSQSFHWMEPQTTIREVRRILRPQGVFAVYDCIWPPVINKTIDTMHADIMAKSEKLCETLKIDTSTKWEKTQHRENFEKYGSFSYVREVLLHYKKSLTRKGLMGIVLSQGRIQTILKNNPDAIRRELDEFEAETRKNRRYPAIFSYRMIVGIL